MKTYQYKLRNENGKLLYGISEAESVKILKRKLRGSGHYFISATVCDKNKAFQKKAKLEEILMFTHRLSSLIEAGVPILTALRVLWQQTEDMTLQIVINHLYKKLEEGEKISDAMKDFPKVFSPMYISLVGIAETSGNLAAILKRITEYLDYQRQIISRTKRATLYPIIVISFALVVLLAMFTFVVPIFHRVLLKLNTPLPLLTKIILAISQILKSPFFILGIAVLGVAGFFLYKKARHNEKISTLLDEYKLRIPVIGNLFYILSVSRFTRSLGMLIGSGIPLVDSFEAAEATTQNRKIVQSIDAAQKQIEEGGSLYTAFKDAKVFPSMFLEMVGVGETSGNIVKVLNNLSTHFDEEVDFKLNRILISMEPLLIMIVGAVVIVTLLAIYLPIFTIWSTLAAT